MVAKHGRRNTAKRAEDDLRIVINLLMRNPAKRKLNFAVGQNVGNAKLGSLPTREIVRFIFWNKAYELSTQDDKQSKLRIVAPRLSRNPFATRKLPPLPQLLTHTHGAREATRAIYEYANGIAPSELHRACLFGHRHEQVFNQAPINERAKVADVFHLKKGNLSQRALRRTKRRDGAVV